MAFKWRRHHLSGAALTRGTCVTQRRRPQAGAITIFPRDDKGYCLSGRRRRRRPRANDSLGEGKNEAGINRARGNSAEARHHVGPEDNPIQRVFTYMSVHLYVRARAYNRPLRFHLNVRQFGRAAAAKMNHGVFPRPRSGRENEVFSCDTGVKKFRFWISAFDNFIVAGVTALALVESKIDKTSRKPLV